jgi:hypothetical protein
MAVKLPMTREQFNTGEQAKFRQSIASAARVSAKEVTIDKIENMRRSGRGLLAGSIRVDTSIVAADQTAANSMANALTVHKINAELGKNGLPQAEILDPPQVKQIVKEESNKTPIIVAAVVSSVVILFAVGACVFIRRRRTATKKADTHVWTDVAGAETLPSPQAARASAPPVPTTTTSSERRTESPSPPIELDQVMMGDNIELDQVMMDVALTRARPTMTAVTPVQLPEINPIDFSKPPEEVKSKIAKRIKEVMSKANFTLSADTGFINTVPMEGVAQLMVAAEVTPARTSKVIPEAGVDSSGEISTSGRSLQDQVMMDVALTPARPTMTAVTPVQLPEINPVDFSKPPEEVKSEIAKIIKAVMSKANITLSVDTGFINTVPMEVSEFESAAVKIQSLARGKRDRERVKNLKGLDGEGEGGGRKGGGDEVQDGLQAQLLNS